MNKICILAAAGIGLSTPALASTPFDGPYVGAQVGYDNYNVSAHDPMGTLSLSALNAHGVEGGVFAGYDFRLSSRWFVGVDATASLSDSKFSVSAGSNNIEAKAKDSFGIGARVGYLINKDTALYARAGWADTKLEITDTGTTIWSKRKSAYRIGAGLESYVSSHISLRVAYDYTDYGHVNVNPDVTVLSHNVNLGVAYHF